MLNIARVGRVHLRMGEDGRRRRGFALMDLAAVLVVLTGVLGLLAICASRGHRLASLTESVANLKRMGEGTTSYGADNQELIFSFTWRADRIGPTPYGDLRAQAEAGGLESESAQAVDIIRRRSGRPTFEPIYAWVPSVFYSHLVLADYYAESLPAWWAISPEDKHRLRWANDPIGFESGRFSPAPDTLSPRWPYSSSYERATCLWTWDYVTVTKGTFGQAGYHNTFQAMPAYTGDPNLLADRRTSEVAYPAHKAMQWDSAQRHHGTLEQYFMVRDSRVPILFADGAVRVRATGNANRGFRPEIPTYMYSTSVSYEPSAWEAPAPGGSRSYQVDAHYRFTRSGLSGRDFDGDEVPVP